MKITVDEATKLSIEVLTKYGLKNQDAKIVTEQIIDAELRGRQAHGLMLLPTQIQRLSERKHDIIIVHESEVSALVDGGDNLGPLVSDFCMKLAFQKVAKNGIALVGAYNKFPFVTAGYPVKLATEHDYIAIVMATAPPSLAPWGGVNKIFGTNPIAIGIPSKENAVVLDMAMSKIPAAEVRKAKKNNELIPEGCAIDKDGNPTTDPLKALEGTLLPFGEYKGYGLAMIIELLAGALVNAKTGTDNKEVRGMLFIVIDPKLFGPLELFKSKVESLISQVKSSKKIRGVTNILFPGERSTIFRDKCFENGIEVSDEVIKEIKSFL